MTTNPTLTHLAKARTHLLSAHGEAKAAAGKLAGARQTRAHELIELLADALAFAERLAFVVEGDYRADTLGVVDRTLRRIIPDDEAKS